MGSFHNWNHGVAIVVICMLVLLQPKSIARLVSTPVGIATVGLALASITADSPALGFIALALVITEKKEVDGLTNPRALADAEMNTFNRNMKWVSSFCKPGPDGSLVFHDSSGRALNKEEAQRHLPGVRMGEGCENPCSSTCVVD